MHFSSTPYMPNSRKMALRNILVGQDDLDMLCKKQKNVPEITFTYEK
jgi:hypothetical protein